VQARISTQRVVLLSEIDWDSESEIVLSSSSDFYRHKQHGDEMKGNNKMNNFFRTGIVSSELHFSTIIRILL
jgi:hypothetical protein